MQHSRDAMYSDIITRAIIRMEMVPNCDNTFVTCTFIGYLNHFYLIMSGPTVTAKQQLQQLLPKNNPR